MNFFNLMNNQHGNIKFTLEEQNNYELNFLDMTFFKNSNIYELRNFKKPLASKVLTFALKLPTNTNYLVLLEIFTEQMIHVQMKLY